MHRQAGRVRPRRQGATPPHVTAGGWRAQVPDLEIPVQGAALLLGVQRDHRGLRRRRLAIPGKVSDPVDHTEVKRAFRTIVFTDLKGSTSLLQEVGESVYLGLLDEHDLIIRRWMVACRGD